MTQTAIILHDMVNPTTSLLLLAATIFAVVVGACSSGTPTPTASPMPQLHWTETLRALEHRRDEVVTDYQYLAANIMDLSTSEVFDRAEGLVNGIGELYSDLLQLNADSAQDRAVIAAFAVAYKAELTAYEHLSESIHQGDIDGMQASLLEVLRADNLYELAYEQLESQAAQRP